MKFLVSDTHLFHDKILQFMNRPYKSMDDMVVSFLGEWITKVRPDDTVYHLGDFAFGTDLDRIENIICQLPGKVTLILGNHDTPNKVKLYSKYWKVASAVNIDGYLLTHYPLHPSLLAENTPRSNGVGDCFCIHGHCHHPTTIKDPRYFNMCWDVRSEYQHILPLAFVKDAIQQQVKAASELQGGLNDNGKEETYSIFKAEER